MPIQETPYPCFVCSCDQCGASTWPPFTSRPAAWADARDAYGYLQMPDGTIYCAGCKNKKRKP